MAAEICGWRVSGRVQGVFFRDSARRQAEPLGLSGYAVNLLDGRVEVAAVGERQALAQLELWLRRGPPSARVDKLEAFDPDPAAVTRPGFVTG